MAATTLYRSHSALGDYFRRLRARLGSPAAITAAAHKLARILFAMLRDRRSFDPQLLGILNQKHLRRRQNSLRKYAASLGFDLVPIQDQELLPRDRAEMLLSWQHSGFSLHRSRRVGHEEREDLEQIARYILRNPFSTAKMHFEPGAGSVLYRSRMNKKQGGNFAALSPTDFIGAVTQHIPDKGFQLVRYYGWYSNKARGVRAKTGAAQAEDSAQGHEPDRAPTSAQWRRLIAKIWEADPFTCPDCGAEMRILAFIEEDRVIGRILRHLGLLPDASRGPPLQEPVYEPIYNDLPAVEEEDVVYRPF